MLLLCTRRRRGLLFTALLLCRLLLLPPLAHRLLEQRAAEADRVKDRLLKADGAAAASGKELVQVKLEARRTESALAEAQRQNEKLKEKVAALSNKVG